MGRRVDEAGVRPDVELVDVAHARSDVELVDEARAGTGLVQEARAGTGLVDGAGPAPVAGPGQKPQATGAQLAYWRERLAGMPPALALPTGRPRPTRRAEVEASLSFGLGRDLSRAVRSLAETELTPLPTLLLAAFQVLLHRYTGQDDIVLAARVGPGPEERLPDDVLPLRIDLSGDPAFVQLLGQVRDACREAEANGAVSFERIAQEVQPEGEILRQVAFVVQNGPPSAQSGEPAPTPEGAPRWKLLVQTWEDGAGDLGGVARHDADLWEPDAIAALVDHYRTLLEGIVADPSARLSRLPVMGDRERHRVLVEWNAAAAAAPPAPEACLHHLIERHVAERPDATAVLCGEHRLSYRELDARAARVANALARRGVGPESVVGLCLSSGPDLATAMVGTLKAGAAYVPLDPTYPRERLDFMLRDVTTSIVLTERALSGGLSGLPAELLCLDADWDQDFGGMPETVPDSGVGPQNLAYLIFTSGSTGRPKAVGIAHAGVVNTVTALSRQFGVGPEDRVLSISSPSFDMSVYEILGALASGATVVLPGAGGFREPRRWAELMIRHGVTVWSSAPQLLQMLLDAVDTGEAVDTGDARNAGEGGGEVRFDSLRLALLSGDWIPIPLVARLGRAAPGALAVSLGGAAEVSVFSVLHPVERIDPDWPSIPYGRPMAHQTSYVLDRHLQPVPIGAVGELHLGGIGVGRGYVARPDLTAERFVPDPYAGRAGARLYRTGDLVRHHADGNLEILGRMDGQVKIRGIRVELGEIATRLAEHPGVRECVVLARQDRPGEKRLVAYVVPAGPRMPPGQELRQFLRRRIPAHMVPAAFVPLAALPLSPNGKVDRRSLSPPDQAAAVEPEEGPAPPANALQGILAEIWREVLALPSVGTEEDFFELGGDSLAGTRVLTRIRKVLEVEVPLRAFFDWRTLRTFTEGVEGIGRATGVDVAALAEAALR